VAAATREEFNLEKFSHSTVSRSFKAIEHIQKRALERYLGDEFQPNNIKNMPPSNKTESISGGTIYGLRRFPSVEDTSVRRSEIAVFLGHFHKSITEDNISVEAAARHFVEHLFGKSEKLRN
jgi:hypothetical protein